MSEQAGDHSKALRKAIHDLNGPIITARGYVEELRLVRDDILDLVEKLAPAEVSLDPVRDNLTSEMGLCFERVEQAFERLDEVIEQLRQNKH